ncbi:hypothetical protein JCM10212_005143 [Sporobolomyces blumeae]
MPGDPPKVPLSDPFTITTSDTPPVRFDVLRQALAVNSRFFADMLSVPRPSSTSTTASDDTVQLEEKAKVVEPFLAIISGDADRIAEAIKGLDDEAWELLAGMADKYDSGAVGPCVRTKICSPPIEPSSHRLTTMSSDSKFTILTSDDPPVAFEVFRDILSIVHPFLIILKGDEDDITDVLKTLDGRTWVELAKMADKYAAAAVASRVQAKIWQLEANNELPVLSYSIATCLQDRALIERTARRACAGAAIDFESLDADAKRRLNIYRERKHGQILRELHRFLRGSGRSGRCWSPQLFDALQQMDLAAKPPLSLYSKFTQHSTDCERCCKAKVKLQTMSAIGTFETATSVDVQFPFDG